MFIFHQVASFSGLPVTAVRFQDLRSWKNVSILSELLYIYICACIMIFSPNSVLLRVLNAFLRCPPWCWMVRPPSRGSCLPLSPLVSLCWMVCPPSRRSCLPLSPCLPSCFPLLDCASAFPRVLPSPSPL